MQCSSSTSRNGLEQAEFVAIPLENEGVSIRFTSRVVVGKGKECVTIDLKGFYFPCSISLKRLYFNKVSSWPFRQSWLNRICSRVVKICKRNESIIVYYKHLASNRTFCCYLLKQVKLFAIPFVDDWIYGWGITIMVICHCKVFFASYCEKGEVACCFRRNFLNDDKQLSIPLVN